MNKPRAWFWDCYKGSWSPVIYTGKDEDYMKIMQNHVHNHLATPQLNRRAGESLGGYRGVAVRVVRTCRVVEHPLSLYA